MGTSRIVFLTREPVIHQLGGSTTYTLNLIDTLAGQGAEITFLVTNAASRSALLWFRPQAALPAGVKLLMPGFSCVFGMYIDPFSSVAWARALSRLATRGRYLHPLSKLMQRLFGDRLFTNSWDLTTPTHAECELALREIEKAQATTVIANYAFWGPLLQESLLQDRKRVILMHDLLSARAKLFLQSVKALDSPDISEEKEMQWLSSATCVLAAQQREADVVQSKIGARVLVQPMIYQARRLSGTLQPGRCLFVGANIIPNQTGIRWFIDEVWPLVRQTNPKATLAIAGTICSWLEDDIPGVLKLNLVPSIETEYARAMVCVVPLLIGSGIKIKMIEALSFGKATVSTSIGVQGLEQWTDGAVAVCDDASSFAKAVTRLLSDNHSRAIQEDNALRLIREHYSASSLLNTHFADCVL